MGSQLIGLLLSGQAERLSSKHTFTDAPDTPTPFSDHYREHILPHVARFETRRVTCLKKLRQRSFVALFALPLVLFALWGSITHFNLSGTDIEVAIYAAAAVIMAIGYWVYHPVKQYKSKVKGEIFPHIFSFYGDSYEYSEHCPVSMLSLEPSGIIPHHTTSRTEDYVQGVYKGVSLSLFEAKLSRKSGGKRSRTKTVFKGLFITLSMNKNFSGKTILKRDKGTLFNWLDGSNVRNLEVARLEDPVFEKEFEVYTSDQVEARYLLSTSFMERLMDLSNLFGGSNIECSFYDNQVLLKVPSISNRFEPSSIFKPATFEEDIQMILEEMTILFSMIDLLKLQGKTGL